MPANRALSSLRRLDCPSGILTDFKMSSMGFLWRRQNFPELHSGKQSSATGTVRAIRSYCSWSLPCYCWSLTSPCRLLQVLSCLQRAKWIRFSPQLSLKAKMHALTAKLGRITHDSKGLVMISQPSVARLRVVQLCQCKMRSGPWAY